MPDLYLIAATLAGGVLALLVAAVLIRSRLAALLAELAPEFTATRAHLDGTRKALTDTRAELTGEEA